MVLLYTNSIKPFLGAGKIYITHSEGRGSTDRCHLCLGWRRTPSAAKVDRPALRGVQHRLQHLAAALPQQTRCPQLPLQQSCSTTAPWGRRLSSPRPGCAKTWLRGRGCRCPAARRTHGRPPPRARGSASPSGSSPAPPPGYNNSSNSSSMGKGLYKNSGSVTNSSCV